MKESLTKIFLYGLGGLGVIYTTFQDEINSAFYESPDIEITSGSIANSVHETNKDSVNYPVINDKLEDFNFAKSVKLNDYSKESTQYQGPLGNPR